MAVALPVLMPIGMHTRRVCRVVVGRLAQFDCRPTHAHTNPPVRGGRGYAEGGAALTSCEGRAPWRSVPRVRGWPTSRRSHSDVYRLGWELVLLVTWCREGRRCLPRGLPLPAASTLQRRVPLVRCRTARPPSLAFSACAGYVRPARIELGPLGGVSRLGGGSCCRCPDH